MIKTFFSLLLFIFNIQTLFAQSSFFNVLADSASSLTKQNVKNDPTYFNLNYPNGEVPKNKGVCTDVVIRAYRKMGIDLQKEVHEEIKINFSKYPKIWGLKKTDWNIDHRKVPNLMTFFTKFGTVIPISTKAIDYLPGDIVCWSLSGSITHIGIIVKKNLLMAVDI